MAEQYQSAGGPVGSSVMPPAVGAESRASAAARMLFYLQSVLEPRAVLGLFAEELGHWLPVDRVRFEDAEGRLLHGGARRGLSHRAEYRLSDADGGPLGRLTVERRIRFTEPELERLEEAIILLERPLRNAIAHQRALRQARCDALTGLYNRAALDDMLARELELARRHAAPLALVVLDIDAFKQVNDEHGHRLGDAFLTHVAGQLKRFARGSDLLFRYGGDEFVLLTRQTGADGARCLAARLVRALGESPFREGDLELPVSVSAGIAERRGNESADELFDRADRALYNAKANPETRVEKD
ncbi:GGDEF domain-containing protein [Spiribacter halobius]|uniref:diguanylate cyclase n=1 Tax=Sediminicurvatus halobius TaxID=2182432 RepID=A0A2U2N3X5_9GAMM|nr:GGDEF domain-containing protein [Spiribacter halobius]PWG63674.1 hypothetical protein DEM34_07285 [Spiribacter halobius]UEX79813.1 GGDEF domain-containing protein [Spiribacter halobius]